MPGPYASYADVQAARASGELADDQSYLDAMQSIRGATATPAPTATTPSIAPRSATVPLPDEADVHGTRRKWLTARSDEILANNPWLLPSQAVQQALSEYTERVRMEEEPTTLGAAANRAFSPRRMESVAETERDRRAAHQVRSRAVEELEATTDPDERRAIAARAQGVARSIENPRMEGPFGRALRVVGTTLANAPIEVLGRVAENMESPETAGVLETAIAANPIGLAAKMAFGDAPEKPLVTPQERGRTRRGDDRSMLFSLPMDYFQSVERGEGFMDLTQAMARTQGVQPGTRGYTAASVAGFAGDVIMPWEWFTAGPVMKLGKLGKLGKLAAATAPVGARGTSVASASKAALGAGDVIDVATVTRRYVDDLIARGERPVFPEAVRKELDDMLIRSGMETDGAPTTLAHLERAVFDEGVTAQARTYSRLVEETYRRIWRRTVGSRNLVQLTARSMVTAREVPRIVERMGKRFATVGVDIPAVGRRLAKADGALKLSPTEADGVRRMGRVHGVGDVVTDTGHIEPEGWNTLVEAALDVWAGPSARVEFARANRSNLVVRLAEAVLGPRQFDVPDTKGQTRVRKFAEQFNRLMPDPETAAMAPAAATVIRTAKREIERAGETVLNELRRSVKESDGDVDIVRRTLTEAITQRTTDARLPSRYPTAPQMQAAGRYLEAQRGGVDPDDVRAMQRQIATGRDVVDADLPSLRNPSAPVEEVAWDLYVWSLRRQGEAETFARRLMTSLFPRWDNVNSPLRPEQARAIHRVFDEGGIEAVRKQFNAFSSPMSESAEALLSLATQYRAESLLMEAVDDLAELGLTVPGGPMTETLRHEIHRIMRGGGTVQESQLRLPWDLVTTSGRADTPYHRWTQRTGIEGRSRTAPRPSTFADVRGAEPGAAKILRAAEQLEANGDLSGAQRLLDDFPGDVTDAKYSVWNYHTNTVAKSGVTLQEAVAELGSRRDIHDVVEAMGSGRPVARWAQPGRRPGPDRAPDGAAVDDYIGASRSERAFLETAWKGREQLTTDELARFGQERGKVVERVVHTSSEVLRQQAAAVLDRLGVVVPEGHLRATRGASGQQYLPDFILDALTDAQRRAGINDSLVWQSKKGRSLVGSVYDNVSRFYKMALLTGYLIPNASYFMFNFLGAPFQMQLTLGARGMGKALSSWVTEPGVTGGALMRMSRWGIGTAAPGARRAFTAADGRVYTEAAVASMAEKFGLDTSLARVETSRDMINDVMRMDRRAMGIAVSKKPLAAAAQRTKEAADFVMDNLIEVAHASDQFFRMSVFVRALKEGQDPAAAALKARAALYDYGALTKWERFTMRTIFTFYTWMRKDADAAFYAMVHHPERIGRIARFARDQRKFTLDPEDQLREYDASTMRLMVGRTDPPDAERGVQDHRYTDTFWYGPGLPGLDTMATAIAMFSIVSPTEGMSRSEALVDVGGDLNPLFKLPATLATGQTFGLNRNMESPRTNEVPAWLVESPGGLGMMVQNLLHVQTVDTDDPRRDTTGSGTYYTATGPGAERWMILREALLGRTLSNTMPEYARLIGASPPKPEADDFYERLADIVFTPSVIESAWMNDRRRATDLDRELQDETRARGRRRQ